MSQAGELLHHARSMGAAFHILSNDLVKWEAPLPLPEELLADLRAHKPEIIALLALEPDYQFTACLCDSTPDGTGPERCGVCGLPLICPVCLHCRGCRLMARFRTNPCAPTTIQEPQETRT